MNEQQIAEVLEMSGMKSEKNHRLSISEFGSSLKLRGSLEQIETALAYTRGFHNSEVQKYGTIYGVTITW